MLTGIDFLNYSSSFLLPFLTTRQAKAFYLEHKLCIFFSGPSLPMANCIYFIDKIVFVWLLEFSNITYTYIF